MSEENNEYEHEEELDNKNPSPQEETITKVTGMYKEWFLDYASYVILERAVPAIDDGFKPVQRRIMHSMKDLDDGRYNKVANIVGHTMQYHPHGDASIGDAMVQIGQKELLIDMQGNWGNTLTGDRAAASRYIEARLSKFALDVVFNPKTTEWQSSYDGRRKEPVNLPVKFPMLLAQGGEGIAVGLSTKILPHNFNELIDASIKHLKGRSFKIVPDFLTGGIADFTNYNEGKRGGKVRVRAKISQLDKKTLVISEIPYGTTTTSLIDSILKANDKGKIKINAPVTLGSFLLAPLITEFLKQYPELDIELILSDAMVDAVHDQFDFVFRIGELADSNLIAQKIAVYPMCFSASPQYLAQYSTPHSIEELKHHTCLGFTHWQLPGNVAHDLANKGFDHQHARFRSNSGQALKVSALNHGGILLQPKLLIEKELAQGELIELLTHFTPEDRAVHMLYKGRKNQPYKNGLFIDFVVSQLKNVSPPATSPQKQLTKTMPIKAVAE